MAIIPDKSLGQHWLHDSDALDAMAEAAEVRQGDVVLEVGPGLGTLTEVLLSKGARVTAVEFDKKLYDALVCKVRELPKDTQANLELVNQDILQFDLGKLPSGYKVCANIPYYLTSHLVRRLLESPNPPSMIALLIQKEVAERIVAQPGQMSVLAVTTQFYAEACLKQVVSAELFTPPPQVDSQIIQLGRRQKPLFTDVDTDEYFRLVKAGFSQRRKKLRSSLSAGLRLSKTDIEAALQRANLSLNARPQELSLNNWYELALVLQSTN